MAPSRIPKELTAALAASALARKRFEDLAPSHQHQYIEWVDEAKKPETRVRRAAKAVEMLVGEREG